VFFVKDTKRLTDIIVIGGGPAGLLLSSKAGRQLTVRVVEKNRLGQTSKFWLTAERRLVQHDLAAAAQYRTKRATLGTFQGSFAFAEGQFTVINDTVLLRLLLERCKNSGVHLLENTKVLSISKQKENLAVQTTDGEYYARLILDASGGNSPFASTFRLHRLEGFYSIFGGHLENLNLKSDDIIGAHVIHFGHPAPIFEIIPTSSTSAFCCVFIIAKEAVDPQRLAKSFEEHIFHNPFFTVNQQFTHNQDLKMGLIPIGRIKRRGMPGVLPVGEAGMLQSPLLGAALNEVLEQADRIINCIMYGFRNQSSGIIHPHLGLPLTKTLNDRLQLALVKPLLDGTLSSFERLVEFLKAVGPSRVYRLFGTELELRDMPTIAWALAHYLLHSQ